MKFTAFPPLPPQKLTLIDNVVKVD